MQATPTQSPLYITTYVSPPLEMEQDRTHNSLATTGIMNRREWLGTLLNAQGMAGAALSIATAALMVKDPAIDNKLSIATITFAIGSLIGGLLRHAGPGVINRVAGWMAGSKDPLFNAVDVVHTASLATGIASAVIAHQHGSVSEPLAIATMASNAVKFFA